ncbi:hypothetical protein EK21DRAFT_98975 [Setomelanomma holmii]|uniref:ATP-grasp domain-containing protein n=1 Tax=Setomelanomma holmii TaxID=210430 RepID=A0A9P4HDN2_9PLEO|nr:hypothetical protein EK21DRAFT_98975 [Setomelanomma holmii]
MMQLRVAVIYQELDPPIINGCLHAHSSVDIAYALKHDSNIAVITPESNSDPTRGADWSFPDEERGTLNAVKKGATHLWANTVLFASHPLQTSTALDGYADSIRVVGQAPSLVEAYDDKAAVYRVLKVHGGFTLATSITASASEDLVAAVRKLDLPYPVIAKPVRGRGSHGVKLCLNDTGLQAHTAYLFNKSSEITVEECLDSEEATVTVLPTSASRSTCQALPIVTRFHRIDGIAPYSGIVAVTANSRVVSAKGTSQDPAYGQAARECERVAASLQATASLRIDIRRFREGSSRPGWQDPASLTAMAAEAAS